MLFCYRNEEPSETVDDVDDVDGKRVSEWERERERVKLCTCAVHRTVKKAHGISSSKHKNSALLIISYT